MSISDNASYLDKSLGGHHIALLNLLDISESSRSSMETSNTTHESPRLRKFK